MANYIRPTYSVLIITPKGDKYRVKGMNDEVAKESNLITSMTLSETRSQLAQKAVIKMYNYHIPKHGYPSGLFPVRSRVFIYAKGGGESEKEVFRGYVWETVKDSRAGGREVTLTCYDKLIYLMNSEAIYYFSAKKKTSEIIATLFKNKGIKHRYNYLSITHPKLPISGTLADAITSKLLDEVKKKKGVDYVIKADKGQVTIDKEGSNSKTYHITRGSSGMMIDYSRSVTMDNMVTKVVISGKTNEDGKTTVEDRVTRNTNTYGILAKVIHKDEETKLSEIKAEAKTILDENALPHKEYNISSMDIPWIRKGDRIKVEFAIGELTDCIVNEVTHNCDDSTMNMVAKIQKKKK